MSTENRVTLLLMNDLNCFQPLSQSDSIGQLFHSLLHSRTTIDQWVKQTASIVIPPSFNELKAIIKDQFHLDENAIIIARFCRDGIELRDETYCLLNKEECPLSDVINVYSMKNLINDDEQDQNSYRYRSAELRIVTLDRQVYYIKVCWIWSFLELKFSLKQEWALLSDTSVNDIHFLHAGSEKKNDRMLCRVGLGAGSTLYCIVRKG